MTLFAQINEMVGEQVEYRELLYQMTRRDLLLRYKQTVMGFGWAVFMPLVNTAVFSVIFTRVAPIDTPVPYPLFAYCGLLVWNFFASSLRFSVLVADRATRTWCTKVYFPREIFPFSAVLVCLVDLAVGAIVLVAMMVYYGVAPSPRAALPAGRAAVQRGVHGGVALLLAMGNLFYRDVKYLFEVVLTVWMFATSVVYPVERVGGRLGPAAGAESDDPDHRRLPRGAALRRAAGPAGPFAATAVAVDRRAVRRAGCVFHRAEFTFAENI